MAYQVEEQELKELQGIEQKLIGMVLWKNPLLGQIGFLAPTDFWYKEHQLIWGKMLDLAKAGLPYQVDSVYEKVKDGWLSGGLCGPGEYITALIEAVYGFNYLEKSVSGYAKQIKKRSIGEQMANGDIENLDQLKDQVAAISKTSANKERLVDLLHKEMDSYQNGTHLLNSGYKTGYEKLDDCIEGLKRKDLIVLAGRPTAGKTTFALNIAYNIALNQGARILYINLEMASYQLTRKIISCRAGIRGPEWRKPFDERAIRKITNFGEELVNVKIEIVDRGTITTDGIRSLISARDYDLVFVDQLTKIRPLIPRDKHYREVAEKTWSLKEMAKEYDIPIVLLHQLNRALEDRQEKRPMLSDLRDSGAIEEDADMVIFVHRKAIFSSYDERAMREDQAAEIIVAKNKMGGIGPIKFIFDGELAEFKEAKI